MSSQLKVDKMWQSVLTQVSEVSSSSMALKLKYELEKLSNEQIFQKKTKFVYFSFWNQIFYL